MFTISQSAMTPGREVNFMIIMLILAIVCAMLAGLKLLEGVSLSVIVYAVVAAICLVIYLISFIEKKRDA
jgi:Flp pilus assembly protein TadB